MSAAVQSAQHRFGLLAAQRWLVREAGRFRVGGEA